MPGTRFGHASVIVRPGSGSTVEKTKAFERAGVRVVENYSDIPEAVTASMR
jgi:succinyl-CoA synthetase alpha subunit